MKYWTYFKLHADTNTLMMNKVSSTYFPYSSSCSLTDGSTLDPCFSIDIESSSFTNIGNFKTTQAYANWVDPTYKLQYQGSVIDLVGFRGHVKLIGNTFTGNTVKYTSCDAAANMDSSSKSSSYKDKYPSYGTKSVLQIKSIISIVNHAF